ARVERRVDAARGAAGEARELVVRDLAEPAVGANAAPAARPGDTKPHAGAPRRLFDPSQVLAGLERADGEHVLALCPRPLGAERLADSDRDDADLLLGNAQQLDELAPRELRGR